jgi:hypothetical protein
VALRPQVPHPWSIACSVVVGHMLSGWLVATCHSLRNLADALYRIPSRDFLLDGGR